MKAFLSDSILFDYKNEYIYISMYKTFTRSEMNLAVFKKKNSILKRTYSMWFHIYNIVTV